MIVTRTTELESVLMCPLKATTVGFNGNPQTLFLGDIAHTAHRYPALALEQAKDFTKELAKMEDIKEDDAYNILVQICEQWAKFVEDMKDVEHYYEVKFGKYINDVWITGTIDFFMITNEWVEIIDFKTSRSLKYYDDTEDKLQKKIYSFFLWDFLKVDEIKFTYKVYPKTKVVQPKNFIETYNVKECWEELHKLLDEYKKIIKDWWWEPKENKYCFNCPLQKYETAQKIWKELCPIWDDWFISWEVKIKKTVLKF